MKVLQYINNKAVGENLGSLEKAKEYNKKISDVRSEYHCCISSLACVNCFHVIHDSACCCVGLGICPNCKHDNRIKITYTLIDLDIQYKSATKEEFFKNNNITNEQCVKLIQDELEKAELKHPKWGGARHGHSVIEEEYEEFKEAVFADDMDQAFKEVAQLGAMCARFIKNHAPSSVRLFH